MEQSNELVDYSYDVEEEDSSSSFATIATTAVISAGFGYLVMRGVRAIKNHYVDKRIAELQNTAPIDTTSKEV